MLAGLLGGPMRKKRYSILVVAIIVVCVAAIFPCAVYASETEENSIYETLKERMDTVWDKGMEQVEVIEPIEITGNLAERILRRIAASLFENLRTIKAGALLIGVVSFVVGGVMVLLAKKDKKIQKKAIGVCMMAIPSLFLILVFGLSWFVSVFR